MSHKCTGCRYLYKTMVNDGRNRYNALSDEYEITQIRKEQECCGSVAGGQVLDKEQPRCKEFEKG